MGTHEFILPNRLVVEQVAQNLNQYSYAIYNYYGSGPIAIVKRHRFARALALGAKVGADRVIDMGCADGPLLPSLAQYYSHVTAIDLSEDFVACSQRLIDALHLKNVETLCNAGLSPEQMRERIGGDYRLMYLLETLEHTGQQPDIWGTKMAFLHDCFSLLAPDGQIVITVPKMVGMIMLFKNLLQRSLGMKRDRMTWRQLLRSAFLKDTDELEPLWQGHHVGFNHLKLDQHLHKSFRIHDRSESAISVFYRVGRQ